MTHRSVHWRTPIGEAFCSRCGRRWACHWSVWNMGGRRCLECDDDTLEWRPT